MLEVEFGQASHPGKVRTNNEDALGSYIPSSRQQARSHGYLFAMADGVGGLDLGEVASATAIDVVTRGFADAQDGTMLISLLPRLIQHANAAVHDAALTPERRGRKMATTLVLCALRNDQAIVSHVGDSRCYLVRQRLAKSITRDHTWVNEQRKLRLISNSDMAESASRHVLTRSLGPELFVAADTVAFPVLTGDVLVLCSDGLHGATGPTGGMTEDRIAAIVSQEKNTDAIASELVSTAIDLDGGDNTTALVIRISGVERVGMYRGRPYRLPS